MRFAEAANELSRLDEDGLSSVAGLVRRQLSLESDIEGLEELLKQRKEELRSIAEDLLPSALEEYGLKELRMDDGSTVSVQTFYGASIPKDRTEEAFNWLRTNNYGDLIKNVVSVSFGRNEDNVAKSVAGELQSKGFATSQKEWVEPMTLKAFVKEQVEAGRAIPSDLFGIFTGRKAKIKGK
jgi:hypothetical protein